jgi:modification methylase
MPEEEYQNWQIQVLMHCWRVLKKYGSMFYNHKNRIKDGVQISPYAWISKTNFIIKQELVWENGSQNFDKIRFYPMTERVYWLSKIKETKLNNTISHKDYFGRNEWVPVKTNQEHKRAFPLQMPIDIISCFPESMDILDPFMGSGTVGVACKKLGKHFVGIDISEDYCKIANQRIENEAKPTKIQLKFEVSDDDPLKKEIFEAFATLMKLLDRKDDAIPLKNGVEEGSFLR